VSTPRQKTPCCGRRSGRRSSGRSSRRSSDRRGHAASVTASGSSIPLDVRVELGSGHRPAPVKGHACCNCPASYSVRRGCTNIPISHSLRCGLWCVTVQSAQKSGHASAQSAHFWSVQCRDGEGSKPVFRCPPCSRKHGAAKVLSHAVCTASQHKRSA
jgi:hypothetical protein